MARGKINSSGRTVRTVGEADIDQRLVPYEDRILHPSEGQPLANHSVYARNRVELAEALPYFQVSRGSTYIENGLVQGFLLNDDDDDGAYRGRQGYMDSEVVIAKIPAALPWHNTVTGRVHSRTRRQARADIPVQYAAFYNNMQENHPMILILDRKWKDSIFDTDDSQETLNTRYLVLDHFLVSHIWHEPSSVPGSGDAFFVRFEKLDLDSASWWIVPQITPPPLSLRDFTPLPMIACNQCGTKCAQIYVEDWFCCDASCPYYGCNASGQEVASGDLNYHPAFLKQRMNRDRLFSPLYDLEPGLLGLIKSKQQYTMSGKLGNRASADLWRGIVCPFDKLCVPRIFWHAWRCDNCKRVYEYAPSGELYQKLSFLQEFGLSQTGHPMVDIICPDDYRIQPPLVRPSYRMDRVFLHGDAFVTLISPTAEFNQSDNGPNDVFNKLLAQAPVGQIPLRRRRLYPFDRHSGKRTPYFAAMYGEQYDFSSLASISQEQTPDSMTNAEALLINAANSEVSRDYKDDFNQASLECYFDDMLMPWHCDGDREVGSTVAMLSLGSKAEVRIRLKQPAYRNSNLSKIITGAYNWRNLAEARRLVALGVNVDDAWSRLPNYIGPDDAPEVVLPLNHGSIVIFQGKHFTKYFEHTIVNTENGTGSLRFTVTARHINAAKHAQVKSRHPYARQAGPKFSIFREVDPEADDDDAPDEVHGDDDDDDSDDPDDNDYYDYSTSRGSEGFSTASVLPTTFFKRGPPSFPIPIQDVPLRPTAPMRAYDDVVDSETVAPAPLPKKATRKAVGRGARGGATRRGRGGRAGRASSGRDRSRSPDHTSGTRRPARVREPTPLEPAEDDPFEGLGPIVHFNAGIDPDNVPRAAPVAVEATVTTKKTRVNRGGGSRPGRKLHWWTATEMEALRQAGLRVTKGESTWTEEMVNVPEGVTISNAKDRYWKKCKKMESVAVK